MRAATNLAQSGLVAVGPMVSVDIAMSGAKMSRTSYAPNMVQFESLSSAMPEHLTQSLARQSPIIRESKLIDHIHNNSILL